ncbi:MAG: helix-turn-helix domain-containing protein [Phycisphaerae bacterium]
MSSQAAAASPIHAMIQIGPELADLLAERLRPAIRDAVLEAIKGRPPSSIAATASVPVEVGVELSITEQQKAKAFKTELLGTNRSLDDRFMIDARTVAKLLDVSTRTLYRLCDVGAMPKPTKIGKVVRWRAEEIKAWVNADCPMMKDWQWPQQGVSVTNSRKPGKR